MNKMANRWTEEQQKAINIEGNNVIVSAGAGSGKTAVLSERVLRKVQNGIHVSELLILTFTKAAAQEMKDRIRRKLIENNLKEEVELLDGAYITTFDSFSLSMVKKYYYTLGISSDIRISDGVQLEILKRDILEGIMGEYYREGREDFINFISNFSLKDDQEVMEIIMSLSNKLSLKYDRREFLEHYIEKYYSQEVLENLINEYLECIQDLFHNFQETASTLASLLEDKKLKTLLEKTTSFMNSKNYEELYQNLNQLELPRSNGYSEEEKEIHEQLKILRDELKKLCISENTSTMYEELMDTASNTKIMVEILLELDKRFMNKKRQASLYDFNDISHLAIKLVKENHNIREEIKNTFKEILIDEYQDTSDTQEELIQLISNHNVYMVGDIKQSIYRFRNANPYIFKNKYDLYTQDEKNGYKIDLNKNFRSRGEVLANINMIFDHIMDDYIGGANYQQSHQAIFGNTSYNEEGKTIQNYNLSIKTYSKKKEITDVEQEAFIIARDIQDKIKTHYQIFDKDLKILREATYSDFVILMDKKKNFDLYKKIFEYLGIPLTVYREERINNTDDFLVLHSLFKLVLSVYHEDYGTDFRYHFLSLARSFLFRYSDHDIFMIFKDKSFKSTEIVKKALDIKEEIDNLPLRDIFHLILKKYHYYDKILTTLDIIKCEKCIEYLDNLIISLKDCDIEEFMYYLDRVIEKDFDIQYDCSIPDTDSVKMMSIHKSKGLEFPICYFADLQNRFNMREQKEAVIFNQKYGIIIPKMEEERKDTIRKTLYKRLDTREEISERIRLFYVALTRCKEHIILVCPELEEIKSIDDKVIAPFIRMKYTSFYSILKSIWNKLVPYIEKVENNYYSKDYLYKIKNTEIDDQDSPELEVKEIQFSHEEVLEEHFSNAVRSIITKEENELLDIGTQVHQVLEYLDFRKPNLDSLHLNNYIKRKIEKFLTSDIIQSNLQSKFYKEYEFMTITEDKKLHGVIDLMIENQEEIIIIDYKLKDIEKEYYANQLNGYKKYIQTITHKKVSIYLYSIIDEKFKSLELKEEVGKC